jgi:hypothetical protein
MRKTVLFAALCLAGWSANAQSPGSALSIDANANRHAISSDIYGINCYWTLPASTDPAFPAALAAAQGIRATARRWGGNNTSTYHWQFDVPKLDNDWYYEVLPGNFICSSCGWSAGNGSSFNQYADQVRITGGKMLGTVPILGWLPKANQMMCSFDVSKYGPQCAQDPYAQYHPVTCGDGIVYASDCSTNPVYITKNDPTDDYAQFDQTFQAQWIANLLTRYGPANQGGIAIWSLDNEPIWWDSTHRDIHPNPYTYDELLSVDTQYAEAIKQADPTALVGGPVGDNWASLWYSKKDIVSGQNSGGGWWSNPVDRNAHGGTPLLAWYLQQFNQYEQQHGQRPLDYVDMHAYLAPAALNDADSSGNTPPESAAVQALRLESTREFWDPTYVVSGDYWIVDTANNGAPVAPYYIPRVQGLDLATLWGPPKPTDPGAFAFQMYRNYDGIGGAFGETSVQASSADQSQLAVYAAVRSDLNLTAVVINKTGSGLTSTLSLANFQAGPDRPGLAVQRRESGRHRGATQHRGERQQRDRHFAGKFHHLLVIPPASLPVPKPVVAAVTNAASYATAVAPGQMVIVWGSGMGPTALARLALDSNGLVSNTVAGVRVLFDGVPAPIVYVSATQIAVVTPYFGTS